MASFVIFPLIRSNCRGPCQQWFRLEILVMIDIRRRVGEHVWQRLPHDLLISTCLFRPART
jgi:hypothetical protein